MCPWHIARFLSKHLCCVWSFAPSNRASSVSNITTTCMILGLLTFEGWHKGIIVYNNVFMLSLILNEWWRMVGGLVPSICIPNLIDPPLGALCC